MGGMTAHCKPLLLTPTERLSTWLLEFPTNLQTGAHVSSVLLQIQFGILELLLSFWFAEVLNCIEIVYLHDTQYFTRYVRWTTSIQVSNLQIFKLWLHLSTVYSKAIYAANIFAVQFWQLSSNVKILNN